MNSNFLKPMRLTKVFRAPRINSLFKPQCFKYSASALFAQGSGSSSNIKKGDDSWTTFKFSTEEETNNFEMDDRISDAERWVSKQLSDSEAKLLNKALGIDADALDELNGKQLNQLKKKDKNKIGKPEIAGINYLEERVKGFLELNPQVCSGCGTPFQTKSEELPGYLMPDKFKDHKVKAKIIRDKQEAIKILDMAGIDVDSEAAVEILRAAKVPEEIITGVKSLHKQPIEVEKSVIRSTETIPIENSDNDVDSSTNLEIVNRIDHALHGKAAKKSPLKMKKPEFEPLTEEEIQSYLNNTAPGSLPYSFIKEKESQDDMFSASLCVCQRCFKLQQNSKISENLRPGWSDHELLTPKRFEELLDEIKISNAVVLCIVDIFDLQGSLLSNLKQIAGKNPIIIAANKFDLLPKDVSIDRLKMWIYKEIKNYCDLISPRELDDLNQERYYKIQENPGKGFVKRVDESGLLRLSDVHLVSCNSGFGMNSLLAQVNEEAERRGSKVYVMGAANVGKSSFINSLLQNTYDKTSKGGGKSKPKTRNKNVPQATVSNLPGTTLNFLKIRMPNGITMIDTPGLLNYGQLTSKLTIDELKYVIPAKPINTVTLRISEGQSILLGGLATIELLEGRPFFISTFISNEIKIHVTNSTKALSIAEKHMGTLIFPPMTYARWQELGPFENNDFDVEGQSWSQSSADIVISGLGWISITGPGHAKIRVTTPKGTLVKLRNAILPFEARSTTAKFSGGRIIKKSGKKQSSYGWRA